MVLGVWPAKGGRNQGRLLGRGDVSAGPWKIVVEMLNAFLRSIIYSVNIVGLYVPGSVLGQIGRAHV